MLLSSGEQISSSLLAGAIIELGIKARSWLGWQIPIITDDNYTYSKIIEIKTDEVLNFISQRILAGVSKWNRGGRA